MNANSVESVLLEQELCKIMNEPILERSLLNANDVECALSKQEI